MTYVPIPEPTTPSAMGQLTTDQQTLLLAQRQEASSRATLVLALCRMGRFDEAMTIAPEDMKPTIQAYIDAENTPDDERCECIREHDVADYTRNQKAQPKLITVGKYSRRYKYWSQKYNGMATLHVCLECGHRNALPANVAIDFAQEATDLRNKALEKQRKEAYDAELAKGTPVRVYADNAPLPPVPPDPEEPEVQK